MRLARIFPRKQWGRPARVAVLLSVIVLSAVATVYFGQSAPRPAGTHSINAISIQDAPVVAMAADRYERLVKPGRTVVRAGTGVVVATMTDGARTVVLTGPSRSFREPRTTRAVITSTVWVRLLPEEWRPGGERSDWFGPWLASALADRSPDVLAVAMEYLDGAPSAADDQKVRFRGDASFGPSAQHGSGKSLSADFYDYLGVPWTFPGGIRRKPDPGMYGAADSAGFLRLVYGYRLGYPLLGSNVPGAGLPRNVDAMAEVGPGVPVIPDAVTRIRQYNQLQPGDLVFFDGDARGDRRIDCAGIYLGLDSGRRHRFIASRAAADGPTFGDFGGASVLDGGGRFSRGFRAARRL
jgi:cell wall-associated NlpC family hydrolase